MPFCLLFLYYSYKCLKNLTTSTVAGPFDLKRNVSLPVPRLLLPLPFLPPEGPIKSESKLMCY